MNDISSPGSPVLWTGSFTHEETIEHVSLAAIGGKNIDKDLTFLKIRGLLKSFFMLLKHGHLAQDVMTFSPLESPAACCRDEGNFLMGANTGFNAPCEPSR
jgi:hypothetical protein